MVKNIVALPKKQEALGSQMRALIKEKENVLINLELVSLKTFFLLNSENLWRRIIEVEKKKLVKENKEYQRNL